MKIIDLLREEFKDYVKSKYKATKKRSHPVFVNPSSKEVLEAASNEDKFVRFIIDLTNKNFYVFNAIGLVHGDVLESLKLQHTRNILDMGVYKKEKFSLGGGMKGKQKNILGSKGTLLNEHRTSSKRVLYN